MKLHKWEQDALYYILIIVFSISYLTFFGNEISWSENALKNLNSILNAALGGIMAVFIIVQYNHPLKEDVLYDWVSTEIRLKQLSSYISKGFFAIMIFSLNSIFPEWLHMVATGASVIGLILLVSGWYKTWTLNWWVFSTAILLSGIALAIAFVFRTIDVKYPEFALAITGLIFLIKTRKANKK